MNGAAALSELQYAARRSAERRDRSEQQEADDRSDAERPMPKRPGVISGERPARSARPERRPELYRRADAGQGAATRKTAPVAQRLMVERRIRDPYGVAGVHDLPILELPDRAAWASWLDTNHARSTGIWLKIAKKGSPTRTVTQAEAIDEAVCHGWIDGQLRRHDEHFFLQRFSPRRPRSRWSAVNRERARRLIAEGRMKTAGLAEYRAAEADGRLDDAYAPQSKATVPEDFRAALDEHPEANAFFRTLGGVERYRFLYRLHHTKDHKRRAERIGHYIELLSERKTLARD